jgi:hypothetical protein
VDQVFLLLLVSTTSLAAVVIGARGLGLSRAGLKVAVQCALEVIGASVVFFVGNLVMALSVILTVRTVTSQFVSVYFLDDQMLVVLSVIQGIAFHCWRRS